MRVQEIGVALSLLVTLGCVATGTTDDSAHPGRGAATAYLQSVPGDVRCIDVMVDGSGQTLDRPFNLVPGQQSVVLTLTGLPTGSVGFAAAAYSGACGASAATWQTAGRSVVTITAGVPAHLVLDLQPVSSGGT